jgi:threonine dehydrogenase-like Zn-dependent dehydrogenase
MSEIARAFWIVAPGRAEIRDETVPAPVDGQVLVRALFSGISRGTEALVFLGRVPQSEWVRMRAPFQSGDFPAPIKYGYASVGVVEQGPPAIIGRTVFVLHPHQTRYSVPSRAAHVVPDKVPAARAVLAANMETAVNGLWDARPHIGDRVTVVGGGTVGCLVAWLASRIVGCRVELVDINPQRAAVAKALGAQFARPDEATPDADVVVHASGTPEGLRRSLELAGPEASVVELSWYGDTSVLLPLGGPFHSRRLSILSSQVGSIAPGQRIRWSTDRRMQLALALLVDEALDVLITGESPFESLPALMPSLTSPGETLCHRIRYGGQG